MKAVGNGERERSVFQALWEGSLGLGTCLDRFHRAAVSTAWARPESERSTSAAGTDFWKGLAARGESRVESHARDLRLLARHEEESMPGHRVLLQGSVVEGGGLPTKGRLRSSVQLHQRASVRYVACLIHV